MSLERNLTPKEQREYNDWLAEMQETIRLQPILQETEPQKAKRIASLKKDFTKFCRYYFADFMDADFAWFHKKGVKLIVDNTDIMFVGEWPREHAKSVVMDIFLPMYLKALGDLYGCAPTKGSRFVVIGNRIHKGSILAHIVGDVVEGDPKKDTITHLKVYALENPRTHAMDLSEKGVPAWKERYTRQQILTKMENMGRRLALRELFHQHIVLGRVFREEHLPWAPLPPLQNCEKLVTYCDPSYKDTKKNDFKAIALIGKNGKYFDIYKAFCRQCTTPEMVRGHYDLADEVPENKTCPHWMEANFIQDIHLKQYDAEAELREYSIAIRGDSRKKPEKVERIENLSAYAERGLIRFNQEEKHSPDMQERVRLNYEDVLKELDCVASGRHNCTLALVMDSTGKPRTSFRWSSQPRRSHNPFS